MASAEQKTSGSSCVDDMKLSVDDHDEKRNDERIVFSTHDTFGADMKWTHESIKRQDDCNHKLPLPSGYLKNWKLINLNETFNSKSQTMNYQVCDYCKSAVSIGNMKDHLENICSKIPIECPLCQTRLKNGKKGLSSHWDNDCIKYHRLVEFDEKKKQFKTVATSKEKYYQTWFNAHYPLHGRETQSDFCIEYAYDGKHKHDYCGSDEREDRDDQDDKNEKDESKQVKIKLSKCNACQARTFEEDLFWCQCDDFKKLKQKDFWDESNDKKCKIFWTDTSGMDLSKVEQLIKKNQFIESEWNHLQFNRSYPYYGNETKYEYCFQSDYNTEYCKNYCRENVEIKWITCKKCGKRMTLGENEVHQCNGIYDINYNCMTTLTRSSKLAQDYRFKAQCIMIVTLPFLLGIRLIKHLINDIDDICVPKEIIALMNKYYSGVSYYDNNNNQLLPYLRNRQRKNRKMYNYKNNKDNHNKLSFAYNDDYDYYKHYYSQMAMKTYNIDGMIVYGNIEWDLESKYLHLTLREDCCNINGIVAFATQSLEKKLGPVLTFDEVDDLIVMLKEMNIVDNNYNTNNDNNNIGRDKIFDKMMNTLTSRTIMNVQGEYRSYNRNNATIMTIGLQERSVNLDHGDRVLLLYCRADGYNEIPLSSIIDIVKGDKNTILNNSNVNRDYKGRNWFEIITPRLLLNFECKNEKECAEWICYLKILSRHYKNQEKQIGKHKSSLNYINSVFPMN